MNDLIFVLLFLMQVSTMGIGLGLLIGGIKLKKRLLTYFGGFFTTIGVGLFIMTIVYLVVKMLGLE